MRTAPDETTMAHKKLGHDELLDWVRDTYVDLHLRAATLDALIATTHSWRVEEDCAPDSDGAATIITVRVDRDEWFSAMSLAQTPRPAFPEPPQEPSA